MPSQSNKSWKSYIHDECDITLKVQPNKWDSKMLMINLDNVKVNCIVKIYKPHLDTLILLFRQLHHYVQVEKYGKQEGIKDPP